MRIYISGPITKNPNAKEDFEKAQETLEELGYEVINPYELNRVLPNGEQEQYMHVCLKLMHYSEAIYMMDGWEESKGACVENGYARCLGLEIYNGIEEVPETPFDA